MRVGRRSTLTSLVLLLLAVVALRPTGASASTQAGETSGREVFEANCAMCHGGDAAGMMGMHPSLRGAVERLTREGVEVTIREGRATRPPMPAFENRLTDQEIADVIAYLDSLPAGPRNFGPGGDETDGGAMGDGGMMDGGMMGGGVMMLLTILLVLALLVLAVAAAVWIVREIGGSRSASASGSPAREELDRRYASGELSRDEYLERRRDLEG